MRNEREREMWREREGEREGEKEGEIVYLSLLSSVQFTFSCVIDWG